MLYVREGCNVKIATALTTDVFTVQLREDTSGKMPREKDHPDSAGSGQRFGRATPPCIYASIRRIYLFIMRIESVRESERGESGGNEATGENGTYARARVRLPRCENARYSIPHTYN